MTQLRAYFSPAYVAVNARWLQRLAATAEQLVLQEIAHLQAPEPLDPALLKGLHDERYVQDFLQGNEPLASSQGVRWSPSVRDSALAMLGGQVEAVAYTLQHGIAMNIACGFHHAVKERGSGFCAFNGLALIALLHPDKRVLVLDCDEHGGNGTEEFTKVYPNLYNISIFGTRFGCLGGERSWNFQVRVHEQGFAAYLQALDAAAELIRACRPDLIIYQAGIDCHCEDPKAMVGLTTKQLFERDLYVFKLAKAQGIPILFVGAGGYQTPARCARLHVNTVRAANLAYFSG